MTIDTTITSILKKLLLRSGRIAVVCHMTPDGDALGSSLCLMHVLEKMGKTVNVIVPDAPPANLSFLPGFHSITIASYHTDTAAALLRSAHLIVCLDFNDLKRLDRTAPLVEASSAPRIVIDHHLNPMIDAEVVLSHPEVSSTSALLYMTLETLGMDRYIGLEAAECCCTGMMTDTGNFSYNSNDPELYRILAALIEKGVDKDAIYTKVFNTNTEQRIRIMGYAQSIKMQLFREHQAALIALSRTDLDEFGYRRGDTEALVNVPLSIPGITYSIFLREDEPGFVKVSMRSKGEFSVKRICETYFGGGGHKNAAGGEMHAPLSDVVSMVLEILDENDRYLPAQESAVESPGS